MEVELAAVMFGLSCAAEMMRAAHANDNEASGVQLLARAGTRQVHTARARLIADGYRADRLKLMAAAVTRLCTCEAAVLAELASCWYCHKA